MSAKASNEEDTEEEDSEEDSEDEDSEDGEANAHGQCVSEVARDKEAVGGPNDIAKAKEALAAARSA